MPDSRTHVTQSSAHEAEVSQSQPNTSSTQDCTILTELSEEAKLRMELIDAIRQAPDKDTRKQKIQEAADELGKHPRTITRMLDKVEREGLAALGQTIRSDKGTRRISKDWEQFIIKTYLDAYKNGLRMSRHQVWLRVKGYAELELGLKKGQYPSHWTVYEILKPYVEEKTRKVRHPGQGLRQYIKTTNGDLEIERSNQIFQADHTRLDILLVDQDGEEIGCPFLTPVIDSYSGCIMGFYLGFESPGSHEVALALRHAILPKAYGSEYGLKKEWGTFGTPEYFLTDRAKEFKSEHLKQISIQLNFNLRYRAYPQQGGLIESVFDKINKEVLCVLPGYKGSNVQKRPPQAEKNACLTLDDLEKQLVRYFVDHYNQHLYPRVKNQTRFERWQAGLVVPPKPLDERELDICLLKAVRRKVQKYGSVQFKNLVYRGDCLVEHQGELVTLRYDPRNIITLLAYRPEKEGQPAHYLGVLKARDLEQERLSLDELERMNRKIRQEGEAIDSSSILSEIMDRDSFVKQKLKGKKARRRAEQARKERTSQPSKVIELRPRSAVSQKITQQEDVVVSICQPTETEPSALEENVVVFVGEQAQAEGVESIYEQSEPEVHLARVVSQNWNQYLEDNW
ncbi:MAG TPA: Mu transposase C-terminal domain-containing protein [Allocoleopsis sp.]